MIENTTIDRRRLLRMSALGGAGLIVGPTIGSALGVHASLHPARRNPRR